MTKTKLEAYRRLYNRLAEMGFDGDEADTLCRIERTLQRWGELECGDGNEYGSWAIERDETTGKPFMCHYTHTGQSPRRYAVPDREKGALRRLAVLMEKHQLYQAYHQTDPRGCALYIVLRSDVPDGSDISSLYTRGLAVCV
jgi:hypothetical protein